MKGTIAISWGPWGGFYFIPQARLCLGFIAITWIRGVEIDEMMRPYVEKREKKIA